MTLGELLYALSEPVVPQNPERSIIDVALEQRPINCMSLPIPFSLWGVSKRCVWLVINT